MSPWPRQHDLVAPSGQDLPFHLKSAWVPKLTDTMSFASPHSPNTGSSSLCQPACEDPPQQRFRFAAVGTSPSAHHGFIRGRLPSTAQREVTSTAPQFAVRQLCPAHTNMSNDAKKAGRPTTLCGTILFFTVSPAAERAENTLSPRKAPGKHHTPRPLGFPQWCPADPTLNFPTRPR